MDLMEKLSLVLWRERELLETLHFKLEVEQLVLASGRTRWLMHAARDVDAVLATIRETEVLRAVAADEAAAAIGMTSNPSLSALADAADGAVVARSSPSTARRSSPPPPTSPRSPTPTAT